MESIAKSSSKKSNENIYEQALISCTLLVNIQNIGANYFEILEKMLKNKFEGKCIEQGYVKPDSILILNNSSGLIKGSNIEFNITYQCLICCPVEGMKIKCIVQNITKAGFKCVMSLENNPLIIFVARDHNLLQDKYSNINEEDEIFVKILGIRYELNDNFISAIAKLIN